MFSRPSVYRRFIRYFCTFTIILYLFAKTYPCYYAKNHLIPFCPSNFSGSAKLASPYNAYIDQKGKYLPYSGYKILQLVKKPIPSELTDLITFLTQQNGLNLYFKLIPEDAYHITLTNLKNKTLYEKNQLQILKQEQELLDKDDIAVTCSAKQLLLINNTEIRMEIEMENNDQLEEYQKRWNKKFPTLIIEHHTSFYLTLAYQYQNIPNKDIFDELNEGLKQWQLVIEIPLDPIEICSYTDVITYSALVSDLLL
jgi:hypothetical protein